MKYLIMFVTLLVGGIIPIQAVLNTRLGRLTGGPLMGSLISFIVGLLCLFILNISFNNGAILQVKPSGVTPWYLWLGGLIGAIFVAYVTWINQTQGVALTFLLVVSGQIFMSLFIDHYGLLGSEIRTITLQKFAGVVLVIAGIFLIKK